MREPYEREGIQMNVCTKLSAAIALVAIAVLLNIDYAVAPARGSNLPSRTNG